MKRSLARPQTLKHLSFFEVLANEPEGSDAAKLATAGLLTLRMIDHWVLAGPAIVEPESVSVRSVRQAIMALPAREPVRESLLTIVNTMQMLRHVDLVPVLPRVFAYAQILERHHGVFALAADAYQTVVRLGDPEFDGEVTLDAYQALAFCQRRLGALNDAYETSSALVKLAGRKKDRARALRGKMGLGLVTMMRGDLAEADTQFLSVAAEAQRHSLPAELAAATHNRSVVAFRSDHPADAAILAHQALKQTSDPVSRDRVLGDLAAFLIKLELYDAAVDALRILEVTAVSDEQRQNAKANILVVAARRGDRKMFEAARRDLVGVQLAVEARVNLLIETARGLELFDQAQESEALLAEAADEAERHSLGSCIEEIASLRQTRSRPNSIRARLGGAPIVSEQSRTSEVARDLRRMAEELELVG